MLDLEVFDKECCYSMSRNSDRQEFNSPGPQRCRLDHGEQLLDTPHALRQPVQVEGCSEKMLLQAVEGLQSIVL
jgi:hypothetical protein